MKRPRIAICGLHIESSTFSPHLASADDFEVRTGAELLARYPWLTEGGRDWAEACDWLPVLHARALPGGPVDPAAYADWRAEILRGLAELGPVDGIFFDIHGAMSVPGLDDVEGDLITAIRDVVGPTPLVSASMDLHGNVSERLFAGCDLLTCYRMAPHEDAWESRERAARNLAESLTAGKPARPHKALVHVPILLPGEMTSTRDEPARSLYGRLPAVEALPGVLDAAIWVGFAWADEPRCCAAVVVTGDDAEVVEAQALALAKEFWRVRAEFSFVAPAAEFGECLDRAIASPSRPFLLSDTGDNPGAGGAADTTHALRGLLDRAEIADGSIRAVLAAIIDPAAVRAARAAGVGGRVATTVGGRIDTRAPGPLTVDAVVGALADDPAGGQVARLDVGGLQVIVTSRRSQYSTRDKFERLGIDLADRDVVVVKIGYLEPELYEAAADWLLALTPGGVDQDLVRLGHRRVRRPMIPFDPAMADPALRVINR